MLETLKRRFVMTSMLSLLLLLVILIGGVIGISYYTMERNIDDALNMLSTGTRFGGPLGEGEERREPLFGYQINPNFSFFMNHYIVVLDEEGRILSFEVSFTRTAMDIGSDDIEELSRQVLAGEKEKGKISSYKYLVSDTDYGLKKIVFLDVSAQAKMLEYMLRASLLISLLCVVLMFVIVRLVSHRSMKPIADNIEKQKRFVTDAGHEIKTPLAIMQANIDAMELHTGENKWIKHLRDQIARLDGLMKQLLTLSKMDERSGKRTFEELSLSRIAEKCAAAFSTLDASHTILREIQPDLRVQGDQDELEQLLSILLDNAIKYGEGNIRVKLFQSGKKVVLEVINSCSALPTVDPATLFDRFYRADTARTQKSGGYGIGLSIAKAIVDAHKGKIFAFYDDENTIRFRVEI